MKAAIEVACDIQAGGSDGAQWFLELGEVPLAENLDCPTLRDVIALEQWFVNAQTKVEKKLADYEEAWKARTEGWRQPLAWQIHRLIIDRRAMPRFREMLDQWWTQENKPGGLVERELEALKYYQLLWRDIITSVYDPSHKCTAEDIEPAPGHPDRRNDPYYTYREWDAVRKTWVKEAERARNSTISNGYRDIPLLTKYAALAWLHDKYCTDVAQIQPPEWANDPKTAWYQSTTVLEPERLTSFRSPYESKYQAWLAEVEQDIPACVKPANNSTPTHSVDFTSVCWFGSDFRFKKGQQAEAVRFLWTAWESGNHTLTEKTIGEQIGTSSDSFRLIHLFRKRRGKGYHPAWNTMIQKADNGAYYLVPPTAKITE